MSTDSLRTLSRGLKVLRYLSETGGDTGPNIARRFGLSRPTIYRILRTLEERNVVSRRAGSDVYSLSMGARQLSEGLTCEAWAIWVATPFIFELQEKVVWPTDLATFENNATVIRETTHSVSPWSIDGNMAGSRLSMLRSSIGRAYLSFCPESEKERILEAILHSDDTEDANAVRNGDIERMVDQARECGYARRLHEWNKKTCSIAVPLMYGERVLACMNVVWLSSALPADAAIERCLPALKDTQKSIEDRFRSTIPPALNRFFSAAGGDLSTAVLHQPDGSTGAAFGAQQVAVMCGDRGWIGR